MSDDPRGWYAEGLHAANRFVLRDRPMSPADQERLRFALDDPGWRSEPLRIPDGLPVREVVWLKARPLGPSGARVELDDIDYAAIEAELGEQSCSGLHRLEGREYVFVRRESGPEWLALAGDLIEMAGGAAGLIALLAPQIARVVNRLRARGTPAPSPEGPQEQPPVGGVPAVSEVVLEAHGADGARVVARYPADAAPATRAEVIEAFNELASRLAEEDPARS